MKKQYLLLLITIIFCWQSNAQVTDVVTNITKVNSSVFINGELYVAASEEGKVYKIDTSVSPPTKTVFLSGINWPYDLLHYGDYMYIIDTGYPLGTPKLLKVDLTETTPLATEVYGASSLIRMVEKDGYLYISSFSSHKIVKINLDDDTVVATDVITGLGGVTGMAIKGDELYFADYSNGTISKFNLTEVNPVVTDVVTGLNTPSDIVLYGDDFYFSLYNQNKIAKFNSEEVSPTVSIEVSSGLLLPTGLTIYNNELYIASHMANKLVKMALPLTTNSIDTNTITLYPNPATHVVQIKNLTTTAAYTISSVLGEQVATGTVTGEEPITVDGLANGLYFVTVGTHKAIRFVKQ